MGLFFLFAFLLSGCASQQIQQGAGSAWEAFSSIQSALSEDGDRGELTRKVSPGLRKRANAYPDSDAALHDLLYAALVLPVVASHYEKPAAQGRCLVVNGYSEIDRPVVAAIRFVAVDGRLLWDDAFVSLQALPGDFPDRALCPEELRAREVARDPELGRAMKELERL